MVPTKQLRTRATFFLMGFLFFPLIASDDTGSTSSNPLVQSPYHAGLSMAQGPRPYMEDCCQAVLIPQGAFYAVYDGHNGKQVAEYAAANLHKRILQHQEFDTDTNKAITESFEKLHTELTTLGNNDQGKPIADTQGTTAVIALIKGRMLHLAWAGDSRCVVVQQNGSYIATTDHKPREGEEFIRIAKAGGMFHGGHIYDSKDPDYGLACSRSLGDMILNKVGIIPTPQLLTLQLSSNDKFLILASDGIWDVCKSLLAAQMIKRSLAEGKTCAEAARELRDYASQQGSTDNLTVLLVDLKKVTPQDTEQQSAQSSYLRQGLKTVAVYSIASLLFAYRAVKQLIS